MLTEFVLIISLFIAAILVKNPCTDLIQKAGGFSSKSICSAIFLSER